VTGKSTYEELEQRVNALVKEALDRKRAEAALRESEELCRVTFEHAVDAIFWQDLETGLITNCNRAAERLLNKTKKEIIGEDQSILHPPDKAAYYTDLFSRRIEERGSIDEEAEVITKSGHVIPVHVAATVTWVRGRRVIQGIFRDITERKKTDEELRRGESKYSTLVENSLTGIYIDQDETIVFANNRFAEIYGYAKEALIGMESWRLVHPDDRVLTGEMRAKRLSGENAPSEYEARGLTKDHRTIWIQRRNTRIEFQGRPAILGNIVDITKQKEAEAALRKTNEALQDFVDVVSHDLKTPIISIQGFSSRLFKNYQDVLGEKGREYVQRVLASARRMEVLVSDLLALSRMGQVVSKFEDVQSLEVVRKVISAVQDRIGAKEIELVVADDLPDIYCDGERIYQVFENLLVNAVKYGDNAGQPRIEIGYRDGGAFHQFYVKDNGPGIDPKFHRKIFEMFYRLNGAEEIEGTGLGLSIVERIIEHHGGKVWVDSEKGKGATFYFAVPKARVEITAPEAGLAPDKRGLRSDDHER